MYLCMYVGEDITIHSNYHNIPNHRIGLRDNWHRKPLFVGYKKRMWKKKHGFWLKQTQKDQSKESMVWST